MQTLPKNFPGKARARTRSVCLAAAVLTCASHVFGSENAPYRPFAQWAELPEPGQFVAGVVYRESEAYHIWANGQMADVTWKSGGEYYGIDINQGFIALQYGINDHWAADLNLGFTTLGWRYFDNGAVSSTTGLMDISLGVRYQLCNETNASSSWLPTATFRAGAVLPGSYNKDIAFAPGYHSAAIAPELLLRRHFGWTGFGAYADTLYRWNFDTSNDHYIATVGLFQQIKQWELAVGFRHLQAISGSDIQFTPGVPDSLVYPRDVREISDGIEAGFSYTTSKRHIRYAFESLTIITGNNTDKKFWVGASIDIPFSFKRKPEDS